MGRRRHDHCWSHVTKVENSNMLICKYCNQEFCGGASRIKAHLGLGGKRGGINPCSNYPINNEGVYNNVASTSSNPPQAVINTIYSTQGQEGALGVIDTHTSSLVNRQNNLEMMNLSEGVNGSGCNSEENVMNNELEQLFLGLQCDENDIAKQLQCLESRGKKRKATVDVWLKKLQKIKESASDINNLNDTHDDKRKLIKELKWHKEEKPLTLSTEFVGNTLDFNIKKVFKLLEDDEVFVIGIYGMGGVGKTLLATLVKNEVKRDVFWINVSHYVSISKLQHDIAKRIGVKLDEDDERARADNLSLELETKEKLVVILDDVWKYIDLEKVGIHPKVNGIKVIMTTRLKHVCHQMDCQPDAIIRMVPLSCYNGDEFEDDDEVGQDLKLFKLKLGHDGTPKTLPDEIEKIAKCIVERFEGLPLGINVMARTMKGIDDIHQWKHALNKLKRFEMGPEVEEEVLKVLKRSYDNLMDKDLQNCFLYCALLSNWNEYEMSNKDDLIKRLVDCGQMNKNICLEEIFNEGNAILKKLDSHSLISFDEDHVFIHPLVRSMACYIMKESQRNVIVELNDTLNQIPLSLGEIWATDLELVRMENCDTVEISDGLSPNCPKLSTLILKEMSISHVPESFFKYMKSLSILDLSYNESLVSLPNSITNLRSLVSLTLKRCCSLKHVPPLGELQALSRLVISYTCIEEAPQGLEKLTNLKWLDLSCNESLNLELGSFSLYFTKLQYLDLQFTCALIMFEAVQRMKMLECFRGAIDCKLQNPSMQHNLDMSFMFMFIKTYHLILGNVCGKRYWGAWESMNLISFFPDDAESRCIEFQDCDSFTHRLPKDHTLLRIYCNNHWVRLCGALSYSTSSFLRKIEIQDCHQLVSLFCLSGSCSFCTNIHNLEILKLTNLQRLTVICKEVVDVGQSLSSGVIFSCLKEIYIYNCNSIEKLLTPKLVQQLHNLETIIVSCCNSMKEIFEVSNNDDNDSSIIPLPKLTRLELRCLPKLKIVCKGSTRWGSSPEVNISSCPSYDEIPYISFFDG